MAATRVCEPSNRGANALQTAAQRAGVLLWTSRAKHGEMGRLPRLGTGRSRLNPCSDGGEACSGKEGRQPPRYLEANAHRIMCVPYPNPARALRGARVPGPGEAAPPSPPL